MCKHNQDNPLRSWHDTAIDGEVVVTYDGLRPGWPYRVDATEDLTSPSGWTPLFTVSATNATVSVVDTNELHVPFRAYRAVMNP